MPANPVAENDRKNNLRMLLASNPATARFGTALALGEALNNAYKNARSKYVEHLMYSVSVVEGDALYPELHAWVLESLPEQKHRKVKVRSGDSDSDSMISPDSGSTRGSSLKVYFDDDTVLRTTINGHRIRVAVSQPEITRDNYGHAKAKITFEMATPAGRQAVMDRLEQIHNRKDERKPTLKMVGMWGDQWTTRSDLPPRSMDSVIIPAEQKSKLIADLGQFLDSEAFYIERGIPYHRGYMFHGPPGTGKTSLAKALANHYKLDLWAISLTQLREESSLMNLISQVGKRSILLLEDIDSAPGVLKREFDKTGDVEKGLSPQALLGALDGVATPHGLITIMTTNHFDWLDEAMTRAGRMDVIEEIAYPGAREINGLLTHFYRRPVEVDFDLTTDIPQSLVAEICKRNMYDLESALVELKNATMKE